MAWYDNRPDGRTPDTHVVYCVRGPFCFGYGFGPAEAFAHALRELPSFVKSQARERKLPIKWECFEVDPGCEFELYDTGTAHCGNTYLELDDYSGDDSVTI